MTKRKRKPKKADGADTFAPPSPPAKQPSPLAPSAASSVDAAPPVAASGVENVPDSLSEPMATDPSPPSVLAPAPATTTTAIAPSSEKTRLATLIPNPQARQAVASIIATNRKLRHALKEREAERASLQKELAQAAILAKEQSESLLEVGFVSLPRARQLVVVRLYCNANALHFFPAALFLLLFYCCSRIHGFCSI